LRQARPPRKIAIQGAAPNRTTPWSQGTVVDAIVAGQQKYRDLRVPILAIYTVPHGDAQAAALEKGIPSARVVLMPHANHYVYLSNEADVLPEMKAFINSLH
jgi:pimeloyl-ACP methyl ester carboxylesterase